MAGYIGGRVAISSPQQIETKHTLTATASQTSIPNIGYTVGAVHVYQNGVRLVDGTDYTATNGSTVTLETGATEGDQIVIVSHGSFETGDVVSKASGGTFAAAMNYPGGAVTGDVAFGDSNKILMGAGSDLQIYHDGTHSRIDNNTGDLFIQSDTVVRITNSAANETSAKFFQDGAAELYHNNAVKLATTATGATITGALATDAGGVALTSLDIDGGTDIGAALVDADLMIVDDGAGGTNRKATMSRLATYMGTKIGGGMEFLASSGAISDGTASVIFNQFDASKYDYYIFNILAVVPVNDSVGLLMQLSADGTNYDSTNGNYHEETTDNTGLIVSPSNVGGASGELNGASIAAKLYNIHSTTAKTVLESRGIYQDADPKIIKVDRFSNYEASAAAHTAVKILFSSGNIESGEITMFGVVNS